MVSGVDQRETSRTFAAGALRFNVATTARDDRLLVESLFRDLPDSGTTNGDVITFTLTRGESSDSWDVGGPHLFDWPGAPLSVAIARLVAAVNLSALDAEPSDLHLHAAAAAREGRVAILAGERGSGKTTTVAELVKRGWGFVTDESVRLSGNGEGVGGFPKPLSIKPGGRALVDHLEPWMIPAADDGSDGTRFVPIGATGATVVDGGRARLVLLLRRAPDEASDPISRRLHPADAVVALMQETLDAIRFGSAVVRLALLASSSPCYELTLGTPDATVDEIERLFEVDAPDAVPVSVLPHSDAFSPGVVSVAIGDRAVVHDLESGRILALDEGGTTVWNQLGDGGSEKSIAVDGPVIGQFVAQLRALGVLSGAA